METYAIRQHIDLDKIDSNIEITESVKTKDGELFLSFSDKVSGHKFDYKYDSAYEWSRYEDGRWVIVSPTSCPNFCIESDCNPNDHVFEKVDLH